MEQGMSALPIYLEQRIEPQLIRHCSRTDQINLPRLPTMQFDFLIVVVFLRDMSFACRSILVTVYSFCFFGMQYVSTVGIVVSKTAQNEMK